MKNLAVLLFIIFLSGCKKEISEIDSNNTITFKGFTLKASPDWHAFTSQEIDSEIGGITKGKVTLNYDFGWYSNNFDDLTTDTHIRLKTTINRMDALIVRPKIPGKGIIGVYVKVDEFNRFNLYGTSEKEEEIIKIFKSFRVL